MDNKITKKRLNDHLSYDWIKYIAIILAAILLWSLVLTMASPRIPNSMTASIIFVTPGIDNDEMSKFQSGASKILSNTHREVNVMHWNSTDTKTTPQLITTRFATNEGDLIVFDNELYIPKDSTEKDKYMLSSFNAYVDGHVFYPLELAIKEAVDLKFDENEFRARTKKERKFNKVDTEEDMIAAIETEKARLEDIKKEAKKLGSYLGLEGFADAAYPEITNLAYRYRRMEQTMLQDKYESNKSESSYVPEEELVWGINIGEIDKKLVLNAITNLLIFADDNEERDEKAIRGYAMGLLFKEVNMPYFYAYIKVLNYFIDTYK